MKNNLWILLKGSSLLFLLSLASCTKSNSTEPENRIFTKENLAPAENFTGNAWHKALVLNDSIYNLVTGNVYFEPGARTNWHSHPSGQILLVIDGEGFHQIRGEAKQVIKKGDEVKCPPDVEHWHGASAEIGMFHLYIVPNTEKGIVNWMKSVNEEEYHSK